MKSRTLVIAALLVVGCGGPTESATRRLVRRRVARVTNSTSAQDHSRCDASRPGRSTSEYDTNNDGVPDVRKVYQTVGEPPNVHSVLVCREVDLNHDGTKDLFRFYTDEGRALREEEDRDFDGRIDVITHYANGEVIRRELDTNGDGHVDMITYYRDHRPWRTEREVTSNNDPAFRADYWEVYDQTGHVVRIGWDYDHDGRADRWDRIDRVSNMVSTALSTATPAAGLAASTAPDGGVAAPSAAGDGGVAARPNGLAPAVPVGAARAP